MIRLNVFRNLMLWTIVSVGLLPALLFSAGCGEKAPAGIIVFESVQGEDTHIYLIQEDGAGMRPLVEEAGVNVTPAISPDGERLAFASNRSGNMELYVMDMDGSNLIQLTDTSATNMMPAWSPAGTKIAFVSDRVYSIELEGGNLQIEAGMELYIMNADGSDVKRLTGIQQDVSLYPSWSPDGKTIAYMNLGVDGEIMLIDPADRENRVNLTEQLGLTAWSPKWSPDGKYILFMADSGQKKDIYRMDADGGNVINLTADWPAYCVDPEWSPDGKLVVFVSDKEPGINLYVVGAAGGEIKPLTQGDGRLARPSWYR